MLEVRGLSKSFPVPRPKGKRRGLLGWLPKLRRGQSTGDHDLPLSGSAPGDDADPRRSGRTFHAVSDVSFTVQTGAILGLLGPNGAGKTTILRMLSTALKPTAGTARLGGVDIVADPLEVRRRIGFLSGTTGLYGRLTAREMITYYGRLHGVSDADIARRSAELFGILEMKSFADTRNDNMSTGMKQKVSIARTLIHDPEVVILDEPTTGLDVKASAIVLRMIQRLKKAGKTVLFSTHHMHEVEALCSQVVLIDTGALRFEGTIEDMRQQTGEQRLDRAFLVLIGEPPDASRGDA